jgi:ABC-type bacteriocin/lantibiotic exporter with double-glycine peptidase domain
MNNTAMAENNNITPIKRLWLLLKPDKQEITNIYIYSGFSGLVSLSLPLGIQAIINLIQGGLVNTAWIVLVSFVVIGVGVNGLIKIFQFRITENLQQKIFTRGALEFAYRIPRVKMEELYQKHAPELVNRYFDIMSIQKGLSKLLIDFSAASLQVIFGLVLLSLYHPFFIIFSFILLLLIIAIFRLTARRGLETSLLESKHKYILAHWLEELARTVKSFKLAGYSTLPMERADKHMTNYLDAKEKHFKVLVQQYSLLVIFKMVVAAGLLILGGILVMEQVINIGQFVAAEIIILLVIDSVEKLISSLENIYDVITAVEKIGQVTDIELDKETGVDIQHSTQTGPLKVEFNNVTFKYPSQTDNTLKNISLLIRPGERVAITGKNSSGKTTLLHVISGLYKVHGGTITYNDLPDGNININSLRSIIGDYLEGGLLFEGSVLENITMGRPNIPFDNVVWAIEKLHLSEFIKNLPEGFNTIIDPQGKRLSLTVTEKLLLARSVVSKPRLLIIEDTFEHFNFEEKTSIIQFLTHEHRPWTLITVTNDSYFASQSDKIFVLNNGIITHTGTFNELQHHFNP